ncbi:hypothetical protein HJFPF1_01032 [Paramyrothecium foliicola]|nr:hypothetical protein HJFPF1_01032 [Paramyrothecium foliicola]
MSIQVQSRKALVLTPPEIEYEPEMDPVSSPAKVNVIQQQSFSITLDGSDVISLVTALLFLLHFTRPYIAEVLIVLVPTVLLIQNDYRNYLGLGPGGTPSTFRGYLRITWLKVWALRNPYKPPKAEPTLNPPVGIFDRQSLPYRAGPRPCVVGIAPQRQIDQPGSYHCYQAVRHAMESLGRKSPEKFSTERSCIEKHGLALFARHPIQTRCQGEICHVHDSEYSMHMALHPDDIEEVLNKGWGQRHPLGWSWRGITMPVSPHFVMIYAPRDEQELQTICRIIQAAVWYTLAEDISVGTFIGCDS